MAARMRPWSGTAQQILKNERIFRQISSSKWPGSLHYLFSRRKATVAGLAEPLSEEGRRDMQVMRGVDPSFKKLDLSFENAQEAYKSKTNGEIIRALTVFTLCGIKPLVSYNKELMKVARKVMGKNLFEKFMKSSFYGQFVAGEDTERIKPTISRNRMYGVKSILDYSVEKDISREEAQMAEMASCVSDAQPKDLDHSSSNVRYRAHREFGDRRDDVISARTYFYKDEAQCDDNLQNFVHGIDAVSGATNATGFAAIKLTALGRPQLLVGAKAFSCQNGYSYYYDLHFIALQLSEVLSNLNRFYEVLVKAGGEKNLGRAQFEGYLKSINIGRDERKQWFSIFDVSQDGEIDLLDWHNLRMNMKLARILTVPNFKTGEMEPLVTGWTDKEADQMRNMLRRIDTIVQYGVDKDVRVMIDAEQTYFQVAINRLVMEMMRKYNKEKAFVFNTYQCYLKDALTKISTDLELSRRENFYFGAKLVRGAYMDQERHRANEVGYDDPINPNFEATTEMYQRVLCEVMEQIQTRDKGRIAVMVATHNEDSVRYTVQKMKEYNIHASDKLICFGQLLGMCDQVSFPLGQAGYSVYKYVPYGPVEEVLPYLSRRAAENKGILKKVKKEKHLLWSELKHRLRQGQFRYVPPVQDSPLDVPIK